ncbi:unnamed protein product [Soboliphyme baturini]|uniref:Helicase ATP-binding domain-containing protein n=1 Tax=Soboliphyme baturini TaxID=241478 RepID=A0A183J4Z1_9BILA|nr:unnamed protein product [Soboliphyme baturini]
MFCKVRPSVDISRNGGILAEEMGLGKTIEVLSCILCHRYSRDREDRDAKGQSFRDTGCELTENTKAADLLDAPSDCSLNCLCSEDDLHQETAELVQCVHCGTFQHRTCVAWTDSDCQRYCCPNCCVLHPGSLMCKTTLILCPASILNQWNEEIQKHIRPGALSFYIYEGVRTVGYVQPKTLSEYDVVLCSYETLRQEALHLSLIDERRLRKRKRFTSTPTPLTTLYWWRICVDEAQMLGNASCRVAAMCQALSASYFWCITGTPMQKAVVDLYPLFAFLRVPLLNHQRFWHKLLYEPYMCGCTAPLLDVTGRIMRRVAKADLLDQVC